VKEAAGKAAADELPKLAFCPLTPLPEF
jgi:hypothetical protein